MINSIYIQIASYRDPQLLLTIKDCLDKAKYPQNLTFGIGWQHCDNDIWDNLNEYIYDDRFKIIDINYKDSKGVCWVRNLLQNLYQGEVYTLQLDSHHRFSQDWDIVLIEMLKSLQDDGYLKPLITSYIPSFDPDNDPDGRIMIPWKMNFDKFIPEGAVFFLPAPFDPKIDDLEKPLKGKFFSGHFSFTLGQFCQEVKYDPNYYFHGEEINISVRSFTHGYDIFHPNKVVCWHEYTRKNRIKQWDDDKEWYKKNTSSHLRNCKLFGIDGIVNDIDFGIYGFGNIRSLQEYEKYSELSFKNRSNLI